MTVFDVQTARKLSVRISFKYDFQICIVLNFCGVKKWLYWMLCLCCYVKCLPVNVVYSLFVISVCRLKVVGLLSSFSDKYNITNGQCNEWHCWSIALLLNLFKLYLMHSALHDTERLTCDKIYTVSQKRRHYTLVHIFAKYWPIFTILSPTYSVGTVQ